ncbi:hypothetical protein CC86DRAFT_288181 [Ophiobolus disseminans]|uniref:Transcription factor domain-containing protein n=1 Tax=Ophiobolus disseminans TaxID=1469910 RepID=A0A6A7A775_9PLEO|nr:hypothetical protein CC86DRAFT_288181 [Ophiobolus disseminans]
MSLGLENGDDTFALDFDFPPLPYPRNTDFTDFDSSAGITSLDASSNMMCDSTDGEYRMVVGGSLNYMGQPCSTAQIAPSARTRINWSIEQLKLAPRSMVEQNGTPWQHSMLYENHMPRHLQDAYAACALYNARNGTNDEFVARFIRERVRDILADPIPQQPNELLARAHAVMLYQIMLVFGGDVRLYSQAELLLPLMEEIGTALLPLSAQQIDPTGSLPFYPSTAASSAWAAYMFRESFRRTILSLYLFITLCYLLRGETAPCSTHLAFGNRFTLSAHLWNAKSAFEYAIAWNDEKHFLIEGLDFTEVMTSASPEDVDAFGKMIMIGLQGEDDIRGWLHTKGSTL